jgi:hypothetical protein
MQVTSRDGSAGQVSAFQFDFNRTHLWRGGDCNFLVSSESFASPLRGHFLGFAAAVGKAGAAVGTAALGKALVSFDDPLKGEQVVFLIGRGISVGGTIVVRFLTPNVSTIWHPRPC